MNPVLAEVASVAVRLDALADQLPPDIAREVRKHAQAVFVIARGGPK